MESMLVVLFNQLYQSVSIAQKGQRSPFLTEDVVVKTSDATGIALHSTPWSIDFFVTKIDIILHQSMIRCSEPNQVTTQYIEMQQDSISNTVPVLSGPTVITAQPQGEAKQERRPIPVNTLNWISTPRSQLTVLSGTHFLSNVEQLEIQQIVDLSTLLGRLKKRFQYRVKVPKAETLFLAMETESRNESSGWSCTRLTRDDFQLNIVDQCGETAFTMVMNSMWTFALNKSHSMSVLSPNLIGTIGQNSHIIGSSFTVYDAIGKRLCNIYGPNISDCCMYQESQFQVISIDGTHQIASLMHQWDNILHDYIMLITFPSDLDIKFKTLLLAAAFLLEYLYFRQLRR
ncbi:phospholipid scramblase 2-like isoform X2 [Bombus pyrosoma]|uniref:phospholipid scramblase 2-like isoform X2 n=1 Tax=Bombus pyrosoma TaxID=396416 RepID=UPI001CB8AA0A|nr:phospholipid scramblase 2-like isoform X2 [Bombus pyrosoma]